MPGPKMGPRPADFDEHVIKQSPTFVKWSTLEVGQKLRYACRDFVKGQGDDEERLMRRIMIARRNNLKDHQTLKRARAQVVVPVAPVPTDPNDAGGSATADSHMNDIGVITTTVPAPHHEGTMTTTTTVLTVAAANNENGGVDGANNNNAQRSSMVVAENSTTTGTTHHHSDVSSALEQPPQRKKRRPSAIFSDTDIQKEMDVPAVEATRSYRSWLALKDGQEFVYNQKYVKGKDGHDWLLRKNIWRRMRYRRENKRMVEQLRTQTGYTTPNPTNKNSTATATRAAALAREVAAVAAAAAKSNDAQMIEASHIVDETLLATGTNTKSTTNPKESVGGTISSRTENKNDVVHANNMNDGSDEYQTAVEAAVAVAQSYTHNMAAGGDVHNPLGNGDDDSTNPSAAATNAALDAAAKLAAAAVVNDQEQHIGEEGETSTHELATNTALV